MPRYAYLCRLLVVAMLLSMFPSLCAAEKYNKGLDRLVTDMASNVTDMSIKRVAVTGFRETLSGMRYPLSGILEEDLTTKLIKSGRFKVIVKSKTEEVLKELKFGAAGLVDPTKVKQLGKMSQADAILTGSYRKKDDMVLINLQLLNVETGEAAWAGSVEIRLKDLPKGVIPEEETSVYVEPTKQNPPQYLPEPSPRYGPALTYTAVQPERTFVGKNTFEGDYNFSIKTLNPTNHYFSRFPSSYAYYLGVDVYDEASTSFLTLGIDYRTVDVSQAQIPGTTSLTVWGLEAVLMFPVHVSKRVEFYGGVGGRFEEVNIDYDEGFGNNSWLFTAGTKIKCWIYEDSSCWGIDLNYGITSGGGYTDYNTFRVGLFVGVPLEQKK